MSERTGSAIDAATRRLRELALSATDGELLGSEEALVEALRVSRTTVRQVARLLEREGFLRVRRGINGGYFAGRPNLSTVETAMSAYLDTLDLEPDEVMVIASLLWGEAVRKAASLRSEPARTIARRFREKLLALRPDTPFAELAALEAEIRAEVFSLTKARYTELIFHINIAFAQSHFPTDPADDGVGHRQFVDDWRRAKLMELDAIADGDLELGMLAARRSRHIWRERILPRRGQVDRS